MTGGRTGRVGLRYKRAIVIFLPGYLAALAANTVVSFLVAVAMHAPPTSGVQGDAYVLTEKFLPFLNLLVWFAFSALYFGKRATTRRLITESIALGAVWVGLTMLVDLVGFVMIKNPISLSPHDFYIGQFPWIYLIYLAQFAAPLCRALTLPRSATI